MRMFSADIVRTSSRAGETIRDGPNRNCLSIDHVFSSSGNLVVYNEQLFIIACFVSLYCRRYMAKILPIRRKTLSNQSINLLKLEVQNNLNISQSNKNQTVCERLRDPFSN